MRARWSRPAPAPATFAVGDPVAWSDGPGSYAELAVVDADRALAVPAGVSDLVAAALPLQGLTAHYLVASVFPVTAGQDVLVHAGAAASGCSSPSSRWRAGPA